jgi:hypothetical protein
LHFDMLRSFTAFRLIKKQILKWLIVSLAQGRRPSPG